MLISIRILPHYPTLIRKLSYQEIHSTDDKSNTNRVQEMRVIVKMENEMKQDLERTYQSLETE